MIKINDYTNVVFFTGAGMSAESGVPTYRGEGGIWHKYNWEEYACQSAFEKNPINVLEFHEVRRKAVGKCKPHKGHYFIKQVQALQNINIITQNIDGMHQSAGCKNVIELHGSLWRLRCDGCNNLIEDRNTTFKSKLCTCGKYLRPDIVWFGDMLNMDTINKAISIIESCDLFVSIGTSGAVWPAAGFPQIAKDNSAHCVEINTEPTDLSYIYDELINSPASKLEQYFKI